MTGKVIVLGLINGMCAFITNKSTLHACKGVPEGFSSFCVYYSYSRLFYI